MRRTMIDTAEAAELLGVSTGWLRRRRCAGLGPAYIKLGGRVRYDVEDLTNFLLANRVEPSEGVR